MNRLSLMFAAAAILASGACDAKKGDKTAAAGPIAAVEAPNGDWSQVVTQSSAGGFVMGNPNAKVKLVEYGSLTCPHCGEFDKVGAPPLIANYVKTGKVSWEFRNFVRDPYDVAASLVARCNGARSFFGLMRGFYAAQPVWIGKLQAVPPAQLQALQNLPPKQQFGEIGKLAGFAQFAAQRGVPAARTNACLANDGEVNRLVQMQSDAVSQYNIPGTPSFLINGTMLDQTATWEALEPKLKAAIG